MGHNWTSNGEPSKNDTIHRKKGEYVASVFDVAHDNGLRTAMYATKEKFSLFDTSYNWTNGAADNVGADNGKCKIDTYFCTESSTAVTEKFVADMKSEPFNYAFIHFGDGDAAGHAHGWGGAAYCNAIETVDGCLGTIFNFVTTDPKLKNNTVIILTADHGGKGKGHSDAKDPCDYTIPFFVWGTGVSAGKDLYTLNWASRMDPWTGRPDYKVAKQPIRNGDGANLALELLNLSAIPSSTINAKQGLMVKYLTTN